MSKYYDSSGKEVYDAEVAEASDLNTINTAIDTGFDLVEADINDLDDTTEYWSNKSQSWATEAEDTEVEPGQYSSLHHAAKSSASATAAQTAQTASESAQAASETARDLSVAAKDDSVAAKVASETAQAASEAAQLASESARDKAQEWADNAEDVEVETGKYSALHWAAKAEASAATITPPSDAVYDATWDGDTTNSASKNAIYDKIESLSKSDVGLDNVDNTSDADKPISTAQDAGLVSQDSDTGAAEIPAGTTLQRPTGASGHLRYNSDNDVFEGYVNGSWKNIGSVNWQSVSTTDVTASAGYGYQFNTTTSGLTLTLPASPNIDDTISYKDSYKTFDSNPLTLNLNGNKLEGLSTYVDYNKGSSVTLVWSGDSSVGWIKVAAVYEDITPLLGNSLRGGIIGLDFEKTGANEVTFSSGSCKCSDGLRTLVLTSTQVLSSLSTTADAKIYFFLTDSGVIKTDTNISGTNLTDESFRFVGMVKNDSSGVIIPFLQAGDLITYAQYSKTIFATNPVTGTTYTSVDPSNFISERTTQISVGAHVTSNYELRMSIDGTNTVGAFGCLATGADTDAYVWGRVPILLPYKAGSFYVATTTGQTVSSIALHTFNMGR